MKKNIIIILLILLLVVSNAYQYEEYKNLQRCSIQWMELYWSAAEKAANLEMEAMFEERDKNGNNSFENRLEEMIEENGEVKQ